MKKRRLFRIFASTLCLAMMILPMTAYADEFDGEDGWRVRFTGRSLDSNFRSADMDEAVAGLLPGDAITFHVELGNAAGQGAEWYMTNEVLYSLEDRSNNSGTSGGAYEYELTYVDHNGVRNVLFSSDTVGGETPSSAGEGLHEATDALEDYFYLDTLSGTQRGDIYLRVELDGETQGNDYQDTLADLRMNFAVTAVPEDEIPDDPPPRDHRTPEPDEEIPDPDVPKTWIVRTGDDTDMLKHGVLMSAAGLGMLAIAVWSMLERRSEKRRNGGA